MCELVKPIGLRRSGRFPVGDAEFTALVLTTAGTPERIVELAAVRLRADGTVLGELSTAVGPGPALDEVVGPFVTLARDSVLLLPDPRGTHALAAALTKAGIPLPMLPGVHSLPIPFPPPPTGTALARAQPADTTLTRQPTDTTLARAQPTAPTKARLSNTVLTRTQPTGTAPTRPQTTGTALTRARLIGRLVTAALGELRFTEQPRFRRLPEAPLPRPRPATRTGTAPTTRTGTAPTLHTRATEAPHTATPHADTTTAPRTAATPAAHAGTAATPHPNTTAATQPPQPPNEPPSEPAPRASAVVHPRAAWATMSVGGCLMVFTVVALFGGASAAFGVVFGAVGVGALLFGWRSSAEQESTVAPARTRSNTPSGTSDY